MLRCSDFGLTSVVPGQAIPAALTVYVGTNRTLYTPMIKALDVCAAGMHVGLAEAKQKEGTVKA